MSDYSTQPPPSTGTTTTINQNPMPHVHVLPATGSAALAFVALLAAFVILAGLGVRWLGKMIGR
jgi:hypothetical protein